MINFVIEINIAMKIQLFYFIALISIVAVACHGEGLPVPEDTTDLTTPLTIEAIEGGIISILNQPELTILYSKNGGGEAAGENGPYRHQRESR